jgi:hypothetical protein
MCMFLGFLFQKHGSEITNLHGNHRASEALMSYFGNRLTLGYTDLLYVDIMNLDYG